VGRRRVRRVCDSLGEDLDGYYGPWSILIFISGGGIRRWERARAARPTLLEIETAVGEVLEDCRRNKSDKIGGKCTRGRLHTLLALMGVAQLLESAADLLGGPMFAGLFEDVLRDEAVSVRESAERFGGPGVGGLIAGETWGRER